MTWLNTQTNPPESGVVVNTRINDSQGIRNEQKLKRMQRNPESRSLWFYPDGSMYVYYTPNEWENTD